MAAPCVLSIALGFVGVGGEAGALPLFGPASDQVGDEGPTRTAIASPFTVGELPDGYELVAAGRGNQRQIWNSDEGPSHEPFTVLVSRGKSTTNADTVIVSVFGFSKGTQTDLDYLVGGCGPDPPTRLRVDGRRALYRPEVNTEFCSSEPQLVMARGKGFAIRITAPGSSKEELVKIARSVHTDGDRRHAPTVPKPPNGLDVMGSVEASTIVGINPYFTRNDGIVPGTSAALSGGWFADDFDVLAVMTLPGIAADLDALEADHEKLGFDVRRARISNEDSLVFSLSAKAAIGYTEGYAHRAVIMRSAWGDLIVVAALGFRVPDERTLIELAGSVRRTSDREWRSFVDASDSKAGTGGPASR